MPFTQENRLLSLTTPLGEDVLLLQGLSGREGISQLFQFNLDLLSDNNSVSFDDIIGQQVTIRILLSDGSAERYFNGYVSRFAQSGSDARFTHYQMEVVPWLWFLTRNANCKIFQYKTIPDIVQEVFSDAGYTDFRNSLTGSYAKREYCVQYRETDFNFVSRLMEQYGIFYFFEHEDGKHTLVMADDASVHQACPEQESARYEKTSGDLDSEDVITGWNLRQELRTGNYQLTDYNFETPQTDLIVIEPTVHTAGPNTDFTIYDYPGSHMNVSDGSDVAKLRMQEEEATYKVVSGSSVCRAFTTGYKFDLKDHYRDDMNASYILTAVRHAASVGSYWHGNDDVAAEYSNDFQCTPLDVPFRPARVTPRPVVQGPQTALVVGKAGEEIWVDKYGRIKVQFYWDQQGNQDENSSCWIRVSQPWAGKGWGAMWIPRMGQEVIVSFEEGDPDRPIITGRVYNADQTVPYTLPDHQTVSTFQSRSSKGGDSANFNEIRFEDKEGSEQLFINAERDMDQRVEVDSREFVGSNRSLKVGKNQVENIGADKHLTIVNNHTESIGKDMSLEVANDRTDKTGHDFHQKIANDMIHNVGNDLHVGVLNNFKEAVLQDFEKTIGGNRAESVGSNLDLKVGQNRTEQVGGNQSLQIIGNSDTQVAQNYALTVTQNISAQGTMNVVIQAGMQLSLVGPGGFISIGPAGVAIQGTMVLINSGGAAGSGSSANTQAPKAPENPKDPNPPAKADSPEIADDGSKFAELQPGKGSSFQGGGGDSGGGG